MDGNEIASHVECIEPRVREREGEDQLGKVVVVVVVAQHPQQVQGSQPTT